MRFEFVYTNAELDDFSKLQRRVSRGRSRLTFYSLALIVIVLTMFSHRGDAPTPPATQPINPTAMLKDDIPWMIGLACVFVFFFVVNRRAWRRLLKRNTDYSQPLAIGCSAAGVAWATHSKGGQMTWQSLSGWSETSHLFILHQNSSMYLGIPKRLIPDEPTLHALRGWLQMYVSPWPRRK